MEPKAPPTSGLMTRTLCSGMPVTKAVSSSRWMCGVWLDIQIVYSSVPGLYRPMSPRTSSGFGIRRLLTSRWWRTTSAFANAASVPSLSPTFHSNTTLLGAFSWSCGAPGWVAFSASTTAGSGSQSTWIRSSASCAWPGVSATTAATPSPVHLTESLARMFGVLTLFWIPDAPPAGHAIGSGLYGMSAPTITAIDARRGLRRARVDRADVRVRVGAAEDGDVHHPGQLDVVEVAALAGDELGVFDPLDRGAEDVNNHVGLLRPSRRGSARHA